MRTLFLTLSFADRVLYSEYFVYSSVFALSLLPTSSLSLVHWIVQHQPDSCKSTRRHCAHPRPLVLLHITSYKYALYPFLFFYRWLVFLQHSPQLQYTPPQSPYTHSPRGVWGEPSSSTSTPTSSAAATPTAAASTTTSSTASLTAAAAGVVADANSNDQRWGSGGGGGSGAVMGGGSGTGMGAGQGNAVFFSSISAAAAVTRAGGVGSPGSVAGAVAVSAAAAASAAASAAAAAAAAGVVDGGRAAAAAAAATAPGTAAVAAAAGTAGAGAGPVAVNDKLVQLKKEKRVLHIMLKNFEKDFKEKNGREVRARVGGRGTGGGFGVFQGHLFSCARNVS